MSSYVRSDLYKFGDLRRILPYGIICFSIKGDGGDEPQPKYPLTNDPHERFSPPRRRRRLIGHLSLCLRRSTLYI